MLDPEIHRLLQELEANTKRIGEKFGILSTENLQPSEQHGPEDQSASQPQTHEEHT